ncbi:Small nuclear ribonucleoprotein SmD3b [Porphyridium purpureum]|uniref:Small nuclear ribonucleoprotein Sm D3 n=1 Tax=Porphyridium purpureum TaxID=35688 RepID=A0A5J4YP68_PORPP|nr:Small nuclear ribonucleoprotein SmD3b [Porphyridium purpureum]|eukprot:POR0887..scf296_7
MSIGVPIKLLHEAEAHVVTVETRSGEVYRGTVLAAEDNMNVQLRKVHMTRRDGKVVPLDQVFIRGSKVRFIILPDILAHAPIFKRLEALKNASRKRSSVLPGAPRGDVAPRGRPVSRARPRGRGRS